MVTTLGAMVAAADCAVPPVVLLAGCTVPLLRAMAALGRGGGESPSTSRAVAAPVPLHSSAPHSSSAAVRRRPGRRTGTAGRGAPGRRRRRRPASAG